MNIHAAQSIYDHDLDKNDANYSAMTPLGFIQRTAAIYPNRTAVVYGDIRRSWAETWTRVRKAASALKRRGIGLGDTVSVIAGNIPEMFEAHFAVPMTGGVLNTINTRLDAAAIAFILNHAEAKMVMVDPEFAGVAEQAIHIAGRDIPVINIEDATWPDTHMIGSDTYENLLSEGDENEAWTWPADEWNAISLNYTSGTTGDPKGVVYHHRGAYINALAISWTGAWASIRSISGPCRCSTATAGASPGRSLPPPAHPSACAPSASSRSTISSSAKR